MAILKATLVFLALALSGSILAQEAVPVPAPVEDNGVTVTALAEDARSRISQLLEIDLGERTGFTLLLGFGILLATLVLRKVITFFFSRWLTALAARTSWKFDDKLVPALEGPVSWLILVIGLFLSISVFTFDEWTTSLVANLFKAATLTTVFWGVLRTVDVAAGSMLEVATEKDMGVRHFIPLIKRAVRIFLTVIAVILVVQNLGYNVGSLLAGLGIGGLAVALAAQESLGNFFGSISLVADRPFKVGDWIQVGSKVDGDVEEIGLRSTKVRTWSKSLMSIPNKVLANEIVENWSRMPKRRVKQVVGVNYATPPDAMAALVEDIRQLLREDEGVNQDFILVNFTEFGASSLDILVYYFTTTTRWLEHMDIRQRMNLKIMQAVKARGTSIAFPTRTVNFEGEIAERFAGLGDAPSK